MRCLAVALSLLALSCNSKSSDHSPSSTDEGTTGAVSSTGGAARGAASDDSGLLPADASDQDKAFVALRQVGDVTTSINHLLASRCALCHSGEGHQSMIMEMNDPLVNLDSLKAKGLNRDSSNLVSHYMSGDHQPMSPPFKDDESAAVMAWMGLFGEAPAETDSTTCTLAAQPTTIVAGDTILLHVTVNGAASSVVIGSTAIDPLVPHAVLPTADTTYTATVTGVNGKSSCSADVKVTAAAPVAPTCTLTASSAAVASGSQATLTLVPSGLVSSATIDGIPLNLAAASLNVSVNATTTYSASVVGPGGVASCQSTITVNAAVGAPTCTLNASPSSIAGGASSTLTLAPSGNVTSAAINGVSISVGGGSTSVSPVSTTTYTGSVTGSGGTTSCAATVAVTSGAATCTLTANPSSVTAGDSVSLTLTTSGNSQSATLNGASVAAGGASVSVTPLPSSAYWYGGANFNTATQTTYNASAASAGGVGNCSVNVTLKAFNQLTQAQAFRAKLGPAGKSVDDLVATTAACLKCHKTGAAATSVPPVCSGASLDASGAQALFQLTAGDPIGNAAIFMSVIHEAANNHDYSLNVPNGTPGKVGQPSDLGHDYVTVKTNNACPVPAGTLKHKFGYYAGFTNAEMNYIQQWVGRYPN